jgi:hypothetical protein
MNNCEKRSGQVHDEIAAFPRAFFTAKYIREV